MRERRISIHTPVKGVTVLREVGGRDVLISIHTPVKGVTEANMAESLPTPNFNPHTREGCDTRRGPGASQHGNFNPHTREGCDDHRGPGAGRRGDFNPHTREGCD